MIDSINRKFSSYVGVPENENEEASLQEEVSNMCPTLTYKQRLYGFGICFVLGWFLSFLSLITLADIKDNPQRFAFTYTFGSIIALASTCFLWGPMKQVKKMFAPIRIGATLLYLISMALTLYLAFSGASTLAVLGSIFLQFLAMIWYCLSWIPYARRVVTSCVQSWCCGQ